MKRLLTMLLLLVSSVAFAQIETVYHHKEVFIQNQWVQTPIDTVVALAIGATVFIEDNLIKVFVNTYIPKGDGVRFYGWIGVCNGLAAEIYLSSFAFTIIFTDTNYRIRYYNTEPTQRKL